MMSVWLDDHVDAKAAASEDNKGAGATSHAQFRALMFSSEV